jgi:hypothetical protein
MRAAPFIFAAICALAGGACFAQAPQAQGFDRYRILVLRNVFDPDRQPIAMGVTAPPRVVEQPPPKATDFVMLTGVMVNDGKALAFFSGSRPDYDKVIDVNGDIAGAKITRIAPSGIEVDRAGRKIVVAVGQTVPFDNSAPGAPPADAAAPATTGTEALPATPALPGNLSEVMRRMMERRQKELQ